jgi:hypothetical protein
MKFAEPTKLDRNPGGWGTRLFVVLPAVPNTDEAALMTENFSGEVFSLWPPMRRL